MKVYLAPKEIKKPALDFDNIDKYTDDAENYLQEIVKFCKINGGGKLAGEIIKFPVADGYAIYVIHSLKPMELIHIDTWDAHEYHFINSLKVKDIQKLVSQTHALNELNK